MMIRTLCLIVNFKDFQLSSKHLRATCRKMHVGKIRIQNSYVVDVWLSVLIVSSVVRYSFSVFSSPHNLNGFLLHTTHERKIIEAMKFRPCIDLHSGQVKQIVGSTLSDKKEEDGEDLATNFETDRPAESYAEMYKNDNLTGGHVIMLGPGNNKAAKSALAAYPNGLQVGGGINTSNAKEWLEAGASHVIVTSFVFRNGVIDMDRLSDLVAITGKDRLVLDLSCRRKPDDPTGPYYVVTDRWQTYTDVIVNAATLKLLSEYCDEFLVHGVENEGKRCGILEDLVELLGKDSPISATYAGGVSSLSDLDRVKALGSGKVDLTIGSALDCFGGSIPYDDVIEWHQKEN